MSVRPDFQRATSLGRGVVDGIADMIGGTPLVRLRGLVPEPGPAVFLKMEQFNPGGSVKDRTALGIIEHATRTGQLHPGNAIVESSSGNTAIGLAVLGKALGHPVVAICDRHLPAVKRARLRAFGADIVFLPQTPVGLDTVQLRIRLAERLAEDMPGAVTLGQYSSPGNPEVHERTTGPEIWDALDGRVTAFVAAVGTTGTITGVARALKARDPRVTVVGVEPEGSVVFGGDHGTYLVQGGGLSFVPSIFEPALVDRGLKIPDAETFGCIRRVASDQGWMLGGTAGLVVAAIKRIAADYGPNDTIVGLVPDGGDRYVETLFDEGWLARNAAGRAAPTWAGNPEIAEIPEALGCSVNVVPEDPGPDLEAFARSLGGDLAQLLPVGTGA